MQPLVTSHHCEHEHDFDTMEHDLPGPVSHVTCVADEVCPIPAIFAAAAVKCRRFGIA